MAARAITTLSLFGLKNGQWRWGLSQMGTMPPRYKTVPGLTFFKLLGSGKGRVFSLTPDFYLYGLMAVWESEAAADTFFSQSELYREYQQHCHEIWTVKLEPIKTHGLWDGQNPFAPAPAAAEATGKIAVLTRASINLRALPAFWQYGVKTSKALDKAPGLVTAVGLGELPFIRQATFSIWESEQQMRQYAYQSAHHQQVIKKTRQDNWYSEELFARFRVLSSEGSWKGRNPLD